AVSFPDAPQGHGGGQDGRLGTIGTVQLRLRAVLAQLPLVIAQFPRRLLNGGSDLRIVRGPLRRHPRLLRALPPAYVSERLSHATFLIFIRQTVRPKMTARSPGSQ